MNEVPFDERVAETARQYFGRLVDSRPAPPHLAENAISGAVAPRRVLFLKSGKLRSPLLLSSVVAVAAAVIIAVPVGLSLTLRSGGNSRLPSVLSAGAECHMLGTLTRVNIDRAAAPPGRTFGFSAFSRLTSPSEVAEVATTVCGLQGQTPGVYHCPADSPVTYTVTFFTTQQTFPPVTILAGSCPLVSGLGGTGYRLVRLASFWTFLGAALGITGADINAFEGITTPPPTSVPLPTATPMPTPFLPAAGPPCTASQLEVRDGGSGAGLSNQVMYLIFTDRGKNECTLRGYPGVQLLDSHDRLLATPNVVESSMNYVPTFPNNGVGLIPLSNQGTPPGPGYEGGVRGQASLPLQDSDICANSVAAIRIRIGGGPFTLPLMLGGDGGNCESTLFVNPFQPAEYVP